MKYDFSDAENTENKIDLDSVNSEFTHNLDCKEQEFFDIYCGKANKIKKKGPSQRKGGFEVWIDTSTSMRDSDYQFKSGTCFREDFAKRLRAKCGGVQLYQYASSKKQVGSISTLCENHEQNNLGRFKKWLKESTADSVLIITDAGSVDLEFQQLIDSLGGKMTGIEDRMIGAKHLKDYVDQYQKVCQRLKK